MVEEKVILVDVNNNPIGLMHKMKAHKEALLHRAFSVFILDSKERLLLQQRAAHKYHSPLLWTNTCCSHQRQGETNLQAGNRRLQEEMGIDVELEELFSFIYKAPFDNGLTEHEYDHVMLGYTDKDPTINVDEVAGFKWVELKKVKQDIYQNPSVYTVWFKIIFEKFYHYFDAKVKNTI